MTRLITLFLFILITSITSKAQSISVTGKIIEQNTKTPIPNATIKCGNFGSSSLKDGSFRLVLNQEILSKLGLTISCIGFETKTVKYITGLDVFLKPSNFEINEVIVGISGLSIIEKAINRIDLNYPQKDFTMNGYIKMHQIAKDDTSDYKFYRNEAIVKVGVSPYKKNATESKVKLIQNRILLKDSLKKEDNYVRFVQGYLTPQIGDYVHNRSFILDKNILKKYEYYLSTKIKINGRKTYVITFNSLKKQDNEGIIYIDSASYAIVKINSTAYNVDSKGFITKDEASRSINYQKINDKWYLQNTSYNSKSKHNNINYNRFEEYHTISIDSNKLDVNYIDVIQELTEDLKLNNLVEIEKWKNYEPFIDSLSQSNLVSNIAPPITEVNYVEEKKDFKIRARNSFRAYIANGGLRATYKINQTYLKVNGYQPLLDKNLSQISNYTLSFGGQLKIYKNLFLETNNGFNLGIGGVMIDQNDYLISNNFVFNKTHHPLTITPSFGYGKIELSKKKEQFYYQESLLYRLSFSYEQKRRLTYSVSLTYVDPFYQRNNGFNLSTLNFAPSFGVIRRF